MIPRTYISRQVTTDEVRRWRMICAILFLMSSLVTVATAQKPQAALPRVRIDTTWNLPTGGTTWSAHTSAQLSSALASAAPGDIIVLDTGVTYTGNFVVPAKSNPNSKWIYVTSSAYNKLPTPGSRVSPRDSANMPKIVTPNESQALGFKDGANYWRFVGIEIYSASTYSPPNYTPGVKVGHALVATFSYPPVKLPDHIVFDRVYVHGDDTHDVKDGILGNMSYVAVVDSYISAIHMGGMDTQAFAAWYTPGPIKLVNNHLEAAGENVFFGNSGGANDPYVPSDIEIRNNYLYKPLSWAKAGVTLRPHAKWTEKNALEIKSAQRVLFDSNIIENVWAAAQTGTAVLLTVRSGQSGNIAVVNDITFTNNVLKNVVSGFVGLAVDSTCGTSNPNCTNAGSQDRWNITNNLIVFYNPSLPGGTGNYGIMFVPGIDHVHNKSGVMRDVVFQHNSMIPAASTSCWGSVFFSIPRGDKPPWSNITRNIWLLDNVMCNEPTGDGGQQGTSGLTQYMGTPSAPPYDLTRRFYGDVMYVPSSNKVYTFPAHNYATTVPFTYVNPPIGDYQLLTPHWTDTSDGQLAGVNFSQLPTSPGP